MFKLRSFCCYAVLALLAGNTAQAQNGTVKLQDGEDTHEKIVQEQIAAMEKLNGILEAVKDEATAKTAVPEVEKVAESMKKIKTRADKLGKPNADQEKALKEKYEAQIKKASNTLLANVFRIGQNPEASKIIQAALQKAQ